MTDRANIIRLAEGLMGWKVCQYGAHAGDMEWIYDPANYPCLEWCDRTEQYLLWRESEKNACEWNPFESYTDAHELESAIPATMHWQYVMALRELIDPSEDEPTRRMQWLIVHATPRQRAEAALAMLDTEDARR